MDQLTQQLLKEQKALSQLRFSANLSLRNAPDGSLRIAGVSEKPQYYHVTDNTTRDGRYISKKNCTLITELAQKDYTQSFLKCVERRLKLVNNLLDNSPDALQEPYLHLSAKRKSLVTPYVLSVEERIQRWLDEHEAPSRLKADDPEIYTNQGERVRSKSEKIIADKLFELGIPYRYEYPLTLDNILLYPDFTLYDVNNDSTVYLEHFGMMDSPEYLINALKKLDLLASYGITIGNGLLLTFEANNKPLNTHYLVSLLRPIIPDLDG